MAIIAKQMEERKREARDEKDERERIGRKKSSTNTC
jgi:hypothetical protein